MRGPREVLTINTPLGYLIEFAYNVNITSGHRRAIVDGSPTSSTSSDGPRQRACRTSASSAE